jgi:tetratricopeptide (TPR) repeat protein
MPVSMSDLAVLIYIVIRFYIPPVIVFIVGFKLLTWSSQKDKDAESKLQDIHIIPALVLCGILGVIVHNQIDFAIFEPAVYTTFWIIIACLIAMLNLQKSQPYIFKIVSLPFKLIGIGAAFILVGIFLAFVLVPVAGNTIELKRANQAIQLGRFDEAHRFLWDASSDDPYDSEALSQNGRLYLHNFEIAQSLNSPAGEEENMLIQAQKCFTIAIERNNASYKNYEWLTETYSRFAEISTFAEKTNWLEKAFDTAVKAIRHYPGCGRLHLKLAKIAEELGRNDIAIEQYKKTIEIEDEYRRQFREIYPERKEIVSRLGEENYKFAKERLQFLTGKAKS